MPFPSEEEVKRLLALSPPPPSPFISLSPPSAEERLASPNHVRAPPGFIAAMGRLRASSPSTHHPLHPSPLLLPPPSSLHLPPHVPTSLPLPSSPLPPQPASLFIPPHTRLCLTALTSRYKVRESFIAAPRPAGGHGIYYGFIGTLDAETRQAVEEVAPTTLEGVNARVTELAAVQEQDTHDVYAVIEDTQDRQTQLFQRVDGLGQLSAALGQIQALQARGQTHADDREGAASTAVGLVFSFLVSDNHNNMPPRRSSATARAAAARAAAAAATPMTAAAVEQLIEARVSAALANHETLRNSTNGQGDGSHNSDTGIRGTVRTPRECTYKDFLNCKPVSFKGTEGVVVLSQWFEKME
ncbi:hypothetical protein Tco_0417652 [Tanacetum coccineum]